MNLHRCCNFDFIVITAPSEEIRRTYDTQIQYFQRKCAMLKGSNIICVADPVGKRIGSGGGTLHALHMLSTRYGHEKVASSRNLIIHSGGDSQRAPMYSVCGKAWMSLNEVHDDVVLNPLLHLIDELNGSFNRKLPVSCLIVACGDVLLNFRRELWEDSFDVQGDGIFVVAVAASAEVARNHGVLYSHSIDENLLSNNGGNRNANVVACCADYYFQKPSLEKMKSFDVLVDLNGCSCALIDTGVVLFTKASFSHLFTLLSLQFTTSNDTARSNMVRFELYNEILSACKTNASNDNSFSSFLSRVGIEADAKSEYSHFLKHLWEMFSNIQLHMIYIHGGTFQHLGTSKEVLDYFSHSAATLPERRIVKSVASNPTSSALSVGNYPIIVNSILTSPLDNLSLFCENCNFSKMLPFSCKSDKIVNCPSLGFLSNFYSCIAAALPACPFNIVVQQVLLKHSVLREWKTDQTYFVLMCVGLNDDVKADYRSTTASILGLSWERFFEITCTTPSDIWCKEDAETSLWTAKLFPVLFADRTLEIFNVLTEELTSTQIDLKQFGLITMFLDRSLQITYEEKTLWRSCKRLSLKDLLTLADAKSIFSWKLLLTAAVRSFSGGDSDGLPFSHLDAIHCRWREWTAAVESCGGLAAESLMCILLLDGFLPWANLASSVVSSVLHSWNLSQLSFEDINKFLSGISLDFEGNVESFDPNHFQKVHSIILYFIKELCVDFSKIGIVMVSIILNVELPDKAKIFPRLLLALNWLYEDRAIYSANVGDGLDWTPSIQFLDNNYQLYEEIFRLVHTIIVSATKDENNQSKLVSEIFADLAQHLVCFQIQSSLQYHQSSDSTLQFCGLSKENFRNDSICIARCPVRIDLAGGWSDTPPICYDQGGLVLNVAISVDGKSPVRCASQFIDQYHCHLQCWNRINEDSACEEYDMKLMGEEIVECNEDLFNLSLNSPCALIKACLLVVLFRKLLLERSRYSLGQVLQQLIGKGILISSFSNLPAGSGMGGSSILASTILKSISHLVGYNLSNNSLIYLVSEVEQLLTTGGGWQDQIGGSFGGFKISKSSPKLPLEVKVEMLDLSPGFINLFNSRTVLVFTGQQRLAKNTLINALRKYSVSPYKSQIVQELVANAGNGAAMLLDQKISDEEKLCKLGEILNRYWALKIEMAPGSEPPHIRIILDQLKPLCCGISLCGAGAGGFGVLILQRECDASVLQSRVKKLNEESDNFLTLHNVEVDTDGLAVEEIPCKDTVNLKSIIF